MDPVRLVEVHANWPVRLVAGVFRKSFVHFPKKKKKEKNKKKIKKKVYLLFKDLYDKPSLRIGLLLLS